MFKKLETGFNNFLKSKYLFWVILVLIFVIARLATWFYPFDSDHWIFWYIGKTILHGGIPYLSAWDHKPPLIFYFNSLLNLFFDGNLAWQRAFLTLLALIDILLFYKLAQIFSRRFYQENAEKVARIGLIFYVIFRNLSQFTSSGNNTENIGLIFLLLMFLGFFWYLEKKNYWLLFLSGLSLSILFFLKGNFLLLSLPIFVELIIQNYKNIKNFLIRFAIFLLPLILQAILWLWYFKAHNAVHDFLVASFFFSSSYAKSAWLGKVSSNQLLFLAILAPLILPLLPFLYKFLKDIKRILKDQFYRFLFTLTLASIFFAFAIGSFYAYYFLILIPTFSLLIIYGAKIFLNLSKLKNLIIILVLILGMAFSWLIL